MKALLPLTLFATCLLPIFSTAQPGKQVRIISSEGIYPYGLPDYSTDRFDLRDSLEAALGSWAAGNVLNNALRDAWPDGLKGDNWNLNRHKLNRYNAYVEVYFKHYTVVNINYNMNQDMEPALRPKTRDFYMIVENSSLSYNLKAPMKNESGGMEPTTKKPSKTEPAGAVTTKDDPSKLNSAAVFKRVGKTSVSILKDLEFFPGYHAGKNEVLQNWLAKNFSSVQAARISARMGQKNWPKGTMLAENDDKYHRYNAYLVWQFRGVPYNGNDDGEELALIFIPREENLNNVPETMRPETAEGMFMVYRRYALEYEGSTAALKSWTEMNGGVAPGQTSTATPAPKPVSPLGADFAKAIQAFPKSFAAVKGALLYTDVFGTKYWETPLKMNKADSVRVSLSQLKGTMLEIYFPYFTNTNSASQLYNQVLGEITAATLPCGPLKELTSENDERTGQRYHTFQPVNASPLYEGLKLRLRQRPTLSKVNGSLTNVYAIAVEISGKK